MSILRSMVCVAMGLMPLRAAGDVEPAPLFSDNMVLQRERKAPVWGTAEPGDRVTVHIAGQEQSATADKNGRWMLQLEPMPAGGPFEMTIATSNMLTIKNVLVGEVWVCSGQSNMQNGVATAANPEQELADSDYPQIRLMSLNPLPSRGPKEFVTPRWSVCSPGGNGRLSAVAFFFGRDLHKRLGVPVGLIVPAWGGAAAAQFTSLKALQADPDLHPVLDQWNIQLAKWDRKHPNYAQDLVAWENAVKQARIERRPPPEMPEAVSRPNYSTYLYDGMIAPLMPYAIRGVIWYQGESDTVYAAQYRSLFPAMIRDWRNNWGQGDFPFLYVQLPGIAGKDKVSWENWPELREAQLKALSVPNTAMAVTIDVSVDGDLHPKEKQPIAGRLALAARAIAYGEKISYCGPIYDSMAVEDGKVRLRFSSIGTGLMAKGGDLRGFAIAGADKAFVPAEARVDGQTVLVWSQQVLQPVAVRYAWANLPQCNLYDREGLPASPFRSDDWLEVGR